MPKKKKANESLEEEIKIPEIKSYLENSAFYSESLNYRIYNGHPVIMEKRAYSYSSGIIKNINDVVFQIIEKDFTLSDRCTKDEYNKKIMINNNAFEADAGGRINGFSLLLLKKTEEILESVTNAVKECIESQNLFNTAERNPILDPINNLYLYGMTSAFSSVYMKNINNNAYREIFNRMNNSSIVIMNYFMMGMALKIAENSNIHAFPVPQKYIDDLRKEIFGSKDAYKKSVDNFLAEKILIEKDFNEEKMN